MYSETEYPLRTTYILFEKNWTRLEDRVVVPHLKDKAAELPVIAQKLVTFSQKLVVASPRLYVDVEAKLAQVLGLPGHSTHRGWSSGWLRLSPGRTGERVALPDRHPAADRGAARAGRASGCPAFF